MSMKKGGPMPDAKQIARYVVYAGGVIAGFFVAKTALEVSGVLDPPKYSELNNMLTLPGTKDDFIRTVEEAARAADASLSRTTRLLIAAHAAVESGWGKGKAAKAGFNYWNLTVGSGYGTPEWTSAGRPSFTGSDTEYREGTTSPVPITQQFRKYPNPAIAVRDYLYFLSKSRFVNFRAAHQKLLAGDATFTRDLGVLDLDASGKTVRVNPDPNSAGFYTFPISKYQKLFTTVWSEVVALQYVKQLQG